MSSNVSPSLRVALCREEDVRAVMNFLHEHWARNHILSRDEALFRWQYGAVLRDGSRPGPPSVLIAWRGDEIVGMLGLTFMNWRQRGCTYVGAWTSHWFVLPEFRGSHLSLLLIKRAAQLADVIGALGINDQAARLLPSLGYQIIPEIPRWVAVIDPEKVSALLIASGAESSREPEMWASLAKRAVRKPTRAPHLGQWEVTEWHDDLAADWDAFWEHGIPCEFEGAVRDSAFLRWRYLDHPIFEYRVWVARRTISGKIGGVAVSRLETVKNRTERVLRVLELLGESRDATDSLLDRLTCEAMEGGVAFADFYCSQSIDGLAEAGFQIEDLRHDPFPIPFRLQPLEGGGRPLNAGIRPPEPMRSGLLDAISSGALYLTKADGDQDRPN